MMASDKENETAFSMGVFITPDTEDDEPPPFIPSVPITRKRSIHVHDIVDVAVAAPQDSYSNQKLTINGDLTNQKRAILQPLSRMAKLMESIDKVKNTRFIPAPSPPRSPIEAINISDSWEELITLQPELVSPPRSPIQIIAIEINDDSSNELITQEQEDLNVPQTDLVSSPLIDSTSNNNELITQEQQNSQNVLQSELVSSSDPSSSLIEFFEPPTKKQKLMDMDESYSPSSCSNGTTEESSSSESDLEIEEDNQKEFHVQISSFKYSHYSNKAVRNQHFLCEICNKKFKVEILLIEHLIGHASQSSYDCDRCETSFDRPMELHRHVIAKHRDIHEPKIRRNRN